MTQQQTSQRPDHQKTTHIAQDANPSVFEELNEETLRQVSGGFEKMPTDTTGWQPHTSQMRDGTTRVASYLKTSPDGKFYELHGKVYRNQVYQLH